MPFHSTDDGQADLPLVEALEDYRRKQPVRLHMPGHGGNFSPWLPDRPAGWDVTEVGNLDDLHNPGGVIAAAQEKAAGLFGARHTFFLVNGATVGIQALIAAACDERRGLVLPRNAHRSVLGGLIISGARPIFLTPEVVPGFGFAASFRTAELTNLLRQNHGAVGAVLAVHPNYYGVTGDLAGAAAICRRHRAPLLVDEAHGVHLRFHPALPADALTLGANGVVQSVHKTGGALTQAAWLHLGREHAGVSRENVAEMLRLLQTTSPSYLLMASLDAARGYLAGHGRDHLDRLLAWIDEAVRKINRLPGFTVLGPGHLETLVNAGHDPTRLVVSVRRLGLTGF
ncbi:MAG: decarboxylase, partial [Firmicutes bacterium]|nr:decarboxylase [Bacillota bacterium]